MFEIAPDLETNIEEFNKKYINIKEMLDDLINYLDKSERELDQAIKQYDYDSVYELIEFLKLCKKNYTVITLTMVLEVYSHQLEDEAFLDLYVRIQDDTFEAWLDNCSLSDLKKLKRCFESFATICDIFPETVNIVLEKEKSYHM
ncbi:unknown [Firmicutes bacterium CAG:822]|nr:unknown [Firmicutes bacterium CAG:822]